MPVYVGVPAHAMINDHLSVRPTPPRWADRPALPGGVALVRRCRGHLP
ncbi:hypothetical protein [Micromonospora chokoriensis]|nr:hypothetical protein [Micromonospora chokoriensis]